MCQKLVDNLYRYPKSNWKNIQRFGGLKSYYKMLYGKRQMVKSSHFLPKIISDESGLQIYFLTGKNHLYQTLFCARSLVQNSDQSLQFILVDDGSFDKELIKRINKQMPGVKIITKEIIDQNIKNTIPPSSFPYLHLKRKIYPHIKKLTDIHTIDSIPFKLVLDSDMLFWNEPVEIFKWLKNPIGALYMLDCIESYGFDKQSMQDLCGYDIPKLVNVGVFGINSNIINWDHLEYWAKTLEENNGASYFLEQGLSAMLIANESKTILNNETYIVNPKSFNQQNILHHYVDLSKNCYFDKAWSKILTIQKPVI